MNVHSSGRSGRVIDVFVKSEIEQKEILGVSIYEGSCKDEVTIVIYKC